MGKKNNHVLSKKLLLTLNYDCYFRLTMQGDAYLKCIDPHCGLEYPITNTNVQCENGHLLDVKYKNTPNESLKEVFANRGRMDEDIIFNESGVWRFRELLNFNNRLGSW